MTPAEIRGKCLETLREYFRILFMSGICLKYIFLGTVAIGVSGCSIQTRFDEKPEVTYKVINPDASHLSTAKIEGTIEVDSFAGGFYYTNIIAVDETRVGDYEYTKTSTNYNKTELKNYLISSISAYDTEISPGYHSLLVLTGALSCHLAEINFNAESNKKYRVMSAQGSLVIVDSETKEEVVSVSRFETHGLWKKIPCEALEEYRDEFISRNKH